MQSFFTEDEMKCPCCGKTIMDVAFIKYLNMARFLAGFPFVVSSGYRCPDHNKKVGSTSTNHTSGMAADIRCTDSRERYEMVQAMIGAGMIGLGIGLNYIHCDINRTTPRIWIY